LAQSPLPGSDGASLGAVVNTASTLLSESRVMGFTESQSACDATVGTSTQLSVEFENDTDQNILNSQNDLGLYANFVDQLDCDADSIDTNLLDLDDLDIFLEDTEL
jgi:hypothetical protein